MTTYQTLQQKAIGLAFILAPLLLTIGAITLLLGIGLNKDGISSWVEGVILAYGFLIFVPVYFGLASILGERAPVFGIICTITGLGMGFGALPSMARIMQAGFDRAGLDIAVFSLESPGMPILFIWVALGLLTSILLGIGFLLKGGIPRWAAVLLILAPIFFVIGQGDDETIAWWRVGIFYPLACVTWFLALAPIGLRYLTGNAQSYAAA